jgi:xanthine dehydrogenase iron-sulfur cluster and FAD-binding subunit A
VALEERLLTLDSRSRGEKGNSAQAQLKERETMALTEGFAAIQAGQNVQDVLKALAAKYPDVAASLLKRFGG